MDIPIRRGRRRRFPRLAALTCAAAAIAALTGTAMAPQTASATASAPGTQPPPVTALSHSSRVTLPTGEQLAVRWSGSTPVVSALPGDRSPVSVITVGSDVYAIPFEAAPYIGSAFDRNLFDVTELAAKEGPDGAGRIPVSMTVTGGGVNVSGVRITSESGPHATGYLDHQSAAEFGAALRARLRSNPGGRPRPL